MRATARILRPSTIGSRSSMETSATVRSPRPRCASTRRDVVVNFAAESHNSLAVVDPTRFFRTNVLGTQTLLDASRATGVRALPPCLDVRGVRRPRARHGRGVHRGVAVPSADAVQRVQGRRRPRRPRVLRDLRAPGHDHELLEQLRAVPVSREGHPAVHDQRARRRAAADVRIHAEQARVAARA